MHQRNPTCVPWLKKSATMRNEEARASLDARILTCGNRPFGGMRNLLSDASCCSVIQTQSYLDLEQDREGVSTEASSRADEPDGQGEVPTCDPAEALPKACELQRFVEKHRADLGEEAVGSADVVVNRIRHTPLVSGLKQARIDSMLSGTFSI